MKPILEVPKVILLKINNIKDLPIEFNKHFHTHLYCHKGTMKFEMNQEQFLCKAGEFLFWFAERNVHQIQTSKNFNASVLLVENNFLKNNIPDQNWSINAILHSRKHPIKKISEAKNKEKVLFNFNRLYELFLEKDHVFYEEIIKMQMKVFILEMWHIFSKEYEKYKSSSQKGSLYERFIRLLEQHCLQKREVRFYAEKLFITPKYLNSVSKSASGITASEWIQRHAVERIELLLQNPDISIAEIANEMEFSSPSFFTRYVKKLLGVTPSEFRNRLG